MHFLYIKLFLKNHCPFQIADEKSNATKNTKFVWRTVENNVGKMENCYQHFLFFPQCFQKFSVLSEIKTGKELCAVCLSLEDINWST